jgi:hypothetical protein
MRANNKILLLFICLFIFTGCDKQDETVFTSKGKIEYPLSEDEIRLLDSVQYRSFLFFMNERNPENGLVKDRSAGWSPSSIAAIGFALPSYAAGAGRDWITRDEAALITLKILQFFYNSVQSPDTNATGYKGFYYHFLRMNSGTREWNCELSSVDTGLLMMGIIFARNYYSKNNETENEIRSLAGRLIQRLEWDFFEMPPGGDFDYTISMGWRPEQGFHHMGWKGYNEALFLYILAAGSGMTNVEQAYETWLSGYNWIFPYGFSHVPFPPLFGHQFSHIFIDFRNLADSYMREKGIDYFENSRRATYVQREYAIENPKGWVGYDSLCWGISACDGPGQSYNFNDKVFLSYAGRGTSGLELNYFDDGTITPYAAISSIVFAPEIVIPAIKSFNERFAEKGLWGPYGYYDAFNLTADWIGEDYIGIDQGPIVLMIENFRSGLVWNYVMKDTVIQKGLERLGFTKTGY